MTREEMKAVDQINRLQRSAGYVCFYYPGKAKPWVARHKRSGGSFELSSAKEVMDLLKAA